MLKEITKNVSYVFFHPNNKENKNNSSTKSLLLKGRLTDRERPRDGLYERPRDYTRGGLYERPRDGLYVCEGQSIFKICQN